jgi:hypothetical protein
VPPVQQPSLQAPPPQHASPTPPQGPHEPFAHTPASPHVEPEATQLPLTQQPLLAHGLTPGQHGRPGLPQAPGQMPLLQVPPSPHTPPFAMHCPLRQQPPFPHGLTAQHG